MSDRKIVDTEFVVVDYRPPIPWGRIWFHALWTGIIALGASYPSDVPAPGWVMIAAAQWPMASLWRSMRSPPLPEWQVAQQRRDAEALWRGRRPLRPSTPDKLP